MNEKKLPEIVPRSMSGWISINKRLWNAIRRYIKWCNDTNNPYPKSLDTAILYHEALDLIYTELKLEAQEGKRKNGSS